MASVFTKIINGEIPSYKLYEDEYTFSFLDIRPVKKGHSLIVPKIEVDYFLDVPEPYYSAVFKTAKLLGKAIQQATKCSRIATVIAGWEVPHFHYHLIPADGLYDIDFKKATSLPKEEMEDICQKIKSFL
jgi:histidine triad (HIT) family protein